MCVAYFVKMLSVCICTTRHYQTSGRLVEELNIGTVLPEIITDADDIFTGTPGINELTFSHALHQGSGENVSKKLVFRQ